MLEPTKKRRTRSVELRFLVPEDAAEAARKAIAPYIEEETSTIPWREALGLDDAELPGRSLRGARAKEGVTQKELARSIGVRQEHISAMENNRRPIGKAMAKRLAEALKVDYRVFL